MLNFWNSYITLYPQVQDVHKPKLVSLTKAGQLANWKMAPVASICLVLSTILSSLIVGTILGPTLIKAAKKANIKVNKVLDSLVVLCSLLQSYPGLLWKHSWICSSPADALPLGVVNVPEIIQCSSLPNLQHAQQSFTDGNHCDHCCNYILKIH